jgi:hypothetical protein
MICAMIQRAQTQCIQCWTLHGSEALSDKILCWRANWDQEDVMYKAIHILLLESDNGILL